jgi:hypothetical protein
MLWADCADDWRKALLMDEKAAIQKRQVLFSGACLAALREQVNHVPHPGIPSRRPAR